MSSFAALASFFAATAFLNVPRPVDPERHHADRRTSRHR
ncbi:MAG: hypothetical protein GAK43_01393 [Stenotrophomonas maltophilia]|nr:MAG: hypothetical protein GAK43_01393 [Stenotrophomonas maltophilia]